MENNTNVNAQNTEQKNYSFLNLKHCVREVNGEKQEFVGITVNGIVVNPTELKTTERGREFIRFSMPISNRGPFIWQFCGGMAPAANENGTVWASVSFWGRTAQRFAKFLEKHPNASIVVTGSIRIEKSEGDDGKEYVNTNIYGDDFFFVRDVKRSEGGSNDAAPKMEATLDDVLGSSSLTDDFELLDEDIPF